MADPRGVLRVTLPSAKLLHFHAFFGEIDQIICWSPTLGVWRPLLRLGNPRSDTGFFGIRRYIYLLAPWSRRTRLSRIAFYTWTLQQRNKTSEIRSVQSTNGLEMNVTQYILIYINRMSWSYSNCNILISQISFVCASYFLNELMNSTVKQIK